MTYRSAPQSTHPRLPVLRAVRLALLLAGLLTGLLVGPLVPGLLAAGAEAEVQTRHELLRSGETDARREAALWLGQHATQESVPRLVEALRDRDAGVRLIGENSIWQIWMRSGDPAVDRRLSEGTALLNRGEFAAALAIFEDVVEMDGEFAEGYNKRATALYYLGDYQGSLADIEETLKRNRYHWGALSGAGMCMISLEQPAAAAHYFERALEINPNLPGVAETIQRLRRLTEGQMM